MQKRFLVLAAVSGGAVLAAAGQITPSKPVMEFTKSALPPAAKIDLRAVQSASHVVVPVELGPLAQRADQALPEQLSLVHEWLADAACGKRNHTVDCNTAKLEGEITRNGPVELQVTPAAIRLLIPVKYALTATGIGWANYLTEAKSGETKLDVSFSITPNPAGGLDATKRDDPTAANAAIPLLKANVRLMHLLEQRLQPVIKAAEDDLRRTLAALPIKPAIARAWETLAQPLELGQGSGLWLKGTPEYYSAGSLVANGTKLTYQVPITSHIAITEAEPSQATATRRAPVLSQDNAPAGPSRVRFAIPIDLEAMHQVAQSLFANGQAFESRPDRFSAPLKVKVRNTRVYPAMRLIGLELDVDVTTLKGDTYSGKLNLAGRPVLDAAAGTVTLADITFPPVSGKDTVSQAVGIPRLGTEPFASAFAAAAKLDVSRALIDALPRATQMLNQHIGDDLLLQATLSQAIPVSLELAKDGAWLLVDLIGEVAFIQDGTMNPATAQPSNPTKTAEAVVKDAPAAAAEKPAKTLKHKLHRH